MKILVINSKKYGRLEVKVDDSDWELITKHIWHVHKPHKKFYVLTNVPDPTAKHRQKVIKLHRLLMGFPDGLVDHADGDTLNNTRKNLRVATHSQNTMNASIRSDSKVGYRGVIKQPYYKNTDYVAYTAAICVNGKTIYGGTFKSKEEAAKKYNEMAIQHHGEFARLNKI